MKFEKLAGAWPITTFSTIFYIKLKQAGAGQSCVKLRFSSIELFAYAFLCTVEDPVVVSGIDNKNIEEVWTSFVP
jgi:hypothetical protein